MYLRIDKPQNQPKDGVMRGYWQATISVLTASMLGFAFYEIGGNIAYLVRGTTHLRSGDPIVMTTAFLTLPFTAACALAIAALLRRAFRSR
jgi:cation transporter-like permease